MRMRLMFRFAAGSALGIYGLGLIGRALVPPHWWAIGLGLGLLAFGILLSLGTMSAHRRPPSDKNGSAAKR